MAKFLTLWLVHVEVHDLDAVIVGLWALSWLELLPADRKTYLFTQQSVFSYSIYMLLAEICLQKTDLWPGGLTTLIKALFILWGFISGENQAYLYFLIHVPSLSVYYSSCNCLCNILSKCNYVLCLWNFPFQMTRNHFYFSVAFFNHLAPFWYITTTVYLVEYPGSFWNISHCWKKSFNVQRKDTLSYRTENFLLSPNKPLTETRLNFLN